jgi:hypothetical protein
LIGNQLFFSSIRKLLEKNREHRFSDKARAADKENLFTLKISLGDNFITTNIEK